MKSKEINERIEYGIDTIDSDETIEIKLKDFMLIYKTFEEFNSFFHQPKHYEKPIEIQEFLGDINSGAYSIINQMYYDVLWNYLPEEIKLKIENGGDPFESPNKPYYFNTKTND